MRKLLATLTLAGALLGAGMVTNPAEASSPKAATVQCSKALPAGTTLVQATTVRQHPPLYFCQARATVSSPLLGTRTVLVCYRVRSGGQIVPFQFAGQSRSIMSCGTRPIF
jgi:hypothetical protein